VQRTVVLNVVGLTRALLGRHTPNLSKMLPACVNIKAVFPAVTCTAQSTYLTGKLPDEHGIVANGWYFRDLTEIFFWRQSNRLVRGEKIWHTAKKRNPEFTCANLFWWYNMATDADWAVTPRPLYCADGRKIPDCYSIPANLRDEFNERFGRFPLFQFWGPAASIASSRWIANAAVAIEEKFAPTLHLVYLPHLDYVLQREGPCGNIAKDLFQIDQICGALMDFFQERRCRIIVLSEYGITEVQRPIHPNRILRAAGYLSIKTDLGREYLDPCASSAFAVSDHQISHIYIKNQLDIVGIQRIFEDIPGIDRVLDAEGKKEYGLDHERSGELVLVSQSDAWFTYYFWDQDDRAPDYARTINIHAKPGYDPCELFIDPALVFPKLKTGWFLLKKFMRFRCLLDVIPLDACLVKGSHGRITKDDDQGPIFMTSEPGLLDSSQLKANDVYHGILNHVFAD
jgi:predicted AlkP superfamily pyrophosphatase or phosphodiesterase